MKRKEIKEVATCMVRDAGLINLSRRALCERAGIPDGSFPHIMGCNFSEFVEELKEENFNKEVAHPVSKTRADPVLRKNHILAVAVALAKSEGYNKITRDRVATGAGVSMGLVTRYFGTMGQLRTAIMRRAVKQGIAEIVAQGLANGDDHALKADLGLKEKAASLLAQL